MFEFTGSEWPMSTEPVYGIFGAVRGDDNARTANGTVWFPVDTPQEASSKMELLKQSGRYDNLQFVISINQVRR